MLYFQNVTISALILVCGVGCSALSDNATKLASKLGSAANALQDQMNGSESTIHFEPVNKEYPYTILIFTEKGATFDELIKKDLDPVIVKDLFPQLSYIDLKGGAALIVYQQGKITFTTYYRRFVEVSDIQVVSATGDKDIVVKKIGTTNGAFTDKVIVVELH